MMKQHLAKDMPPRVFCFVLERFGRANFEEAVFPEIAR